jgi:hypothetical protein
MPRARAEAMPNLKATFNPPGALALDLPLKEAEAMGFDLSTVFTKFAGIDTYVNTQHLVVGMKIVGRNINIREALIGKSYIVLDTFHNFKQKQLLMEGSHNPFYIAERNWKFGDGATKNLVNNFITQRGAINIFPIVSKVKEIKETIDTIDEMGNRTKSQVEFVQIWDCHRLFARYSPTTEAIEISWN